MTRNTLFCQIANPQQYEGVLVVAQQEMDFIRPEQAVEIQLDSLPGKYWAGKLAQVSPEKLTTVSKQLTTKTGGEIETKTDEQGQERPINTVYQANVFLDETTGVLRPGMRGRARIHAAPQTLAQRTWRMIQETLNFKL